MISLERFSVAYGQVAALNDLSLTVAEATALLLAGPSGCGKSTLALGLGGFLPGSIRAQTSGHIRVAGLDPCVLGPARLAPTVVSLFQDPSSQLLCPTVRDEAMSGALNLGVPADEAMRRADQSLAELDIADLAHREPARLSAGQQQRVTLAAALAMEPTVLVLDEPTAYLDDASCAALGRMLARVRSTGATVVISEHRWDRLPGLCNRAVRLDRGRLAAHGAPDVVLPRLHMPRCSPRQPGGVLLRAQGLHAHADGRHVIRGVDLDLREGERVAIVGRNGAGKSTLTRLLAGLTRPANGSVHVCGKAPRPGVDVGLVMQSPRNQLFCNTVHEEVGLGPAMARTRPDGRIDALLERLNLGRLASRSPHTLSGGEQQRTVVAAALALDPTVLILDEPTVGQDWLHLAHLPGIMDDATATGRAALLVTHDATLAMATADRILHLRDGRLTET